MSIMSRLSCEWAIRSFGLDHVGNKTDRALRIVEEAIEYAQAQGAPIEKIKLAADVVYSRPPGEPMQELGGILLTTNIACAALGNLEPDDMLEMELARVLARSPEHFRKRNEAKDALGLTVVPK